MLLCCRPNANSTETGAIKDLVVASVKLGAALGESGKVTLLAADQRVRHCSVKIVVIFCI